MGGSSGGDRGSGCPPPHGKLQVAIGFLRNTGTDPPQQAMRVWMGYND